MSYIWHKADRKQANVRFERSVEVKILAIRMFITLDITTLS